MKTIAQRVKTAIEASPLFAEVLSEGIGNVNEIARQLQPTIAEARMEQVSVAAIAMALRRLKVRKNPANAGFALLGQARNISVKSNVVEFVFQNGSESGMYTQLLRDIQHEASDHFLHISRGLFETIVVVDESLADKLQQSLSNQPGLQRHNSLASITLRLPAETIEAPGVYYPVLKALAWEGISIVEVISVGSELSILFRARDIDRAFSVIKTVTSR